MRNIALLSVLVLGLVSSLSAQRAWTNGSILGEPYWMTGKVSLALADSATTDTTATTTALNSATLNGVLSGKKVLAGYVVIDTALAGRVTSGIVSVDIQGSLDGTTFVTVADSAVSAKLWIPAPSTARTGHFNLGYVDLTNYRYAYWRLRMRFTGSPGSQSTGTVKGGECGRFRFVAKVLN